MNKLLIGVILGIVVVICFTSVFLPRRLKQPEPTIPPGKEKPEEVTSSTPTPPSSVEACTPTCTQETTDPTIEGGIYFTTSDCETEIRLNTCDGTTLSQHLCADSQPSSTKINCNSKCKELGFETGSCPVEFGACTCECADAEDGTCPENCPADPDCEGEVKAEEE